jgi:photosystem II stability/assembly factor-like uncharacterized protein
MRKGQLLWLLFIFPAVVLAQWERIGPFGVDVNSVVVSSTNDSIVYVVSYGSPAIIAKSTDGGASWNTVASISNSIHCMAIDPQNGNRLYLGSGHYLYRSTDGGATWLTTSVTNKFFQGIAVHPSEPSTVYAGGWAYVGLLKSAIVFLKSTNYGVNWTTTILDSSGSYNYGYCIAVDRVNPNNIYIGGYSYTSTYIPRIYKTTDGGSNWVNVATDTLFNNAQYIRSIAIHPTNSNIVYAGTYNKGIFRSTNGGLSWTKNSSNYYNYCMVTTSASPDIAYSGCYGEIYKTTDAGVNWLSTSSGLSGDSLRGLAASQTNGFVVYAGNHYGMFKTTNGGISWANISNNLSLGKIITFANAPSSPSTIYTELAGIGIFKTTNSGSDWVKLPPPGVECGDIAEIAVAYDNPNLVYALEGMA